ncbi:hypothetical protein CRP01_02245 [Flavilitoribacter nigricans DSM 23189 = NBRC 102662]|uniref:Uncharacterized protein n=1 Tax=Flavilitoribacter nigricans (strain ATCC 23147 / DSM 23189 / NBRC 102662 / NCIMB 1420 / SS-2) TaxID=1122177 RepID=A0A2D0NK95_FLAN2|nr:hypothetical protein CRP01_02245 [Flavilitoribacter nigricans DSM 23189 = NBRC 102662]
MVDLKVSGQGPAIRTFFQKGAPTVPEGSSALGGEPIMGRQFLNCNIKFNYKVRAAVWSNINLIA